MVYAEGMKMLLGGYTCGD